MRTPILIGILVLVCSVAMFVSVLAAGWSPDQPTAKGLGFEWALPSRLKKQQMLAQFPKSLNLNKKNNNTSSSHDAVFLANGGGENRLVEPGEIAADIDADNNDDEVDTTKKNKKKQTVEITEELIVDAAAVPNNNKKKKGSDDKNDNNNADENVEIATEDIVLQELSPPSAEEDEKKNDADNNKKTQEEKEEQKEKENDDQLPQDHPTRDWCGESGDGWRGGLGKSRVSPSGVAITISTRADPMLVVVTAGIAKTLPCSWRFEILVPQDLVPTVIDLFGGPQARAIQNGKVSVKSLDRFQVYQQTRLQSVPSYSQLMCSTPELWESFSEDFVFTYQLDSTTCSGSRHGLSEFLKFDYVGAPWPMDDSNPAIRGGTTPVGNGGFSLRRRSVMVEITKAHGSEWQATNAGAMGRASAGAEDVWFAGWLRDMKFHPADFETARAFSAEQVPSDQPFGLHGMLGAFQAFGFGGWSYLEKNSLVESCPEMHEIWDIAEFVGFAGRDIRLMRRNVPRMAFQVGGEGGEGGEWGEKGKKREVWEI